MKYLIYITTFFVLVSCAAENEKYVPVCKANVPTDTLLFDLKRPSLDSLTRFIEVSDTMRVEEKLFKYSIFIPKKFDTVFQDFYGSCTYTNTRTVFTNQAYSIEPLINMTPFTVSDSMYYVFISADTISNQVIDGAYRIKRKKQRSVARQARKGELISDSSYRVFQNGKTRLITERINSERETHVDIELIFEGTLFEMNTTYFGKNALERLTDLKAIVESFEVEKVDE